MFIARAVQKGGPLSISPMGGFPSLPALSNKIASFYASVHPERIFDGPQNIEIVTPPEIPELSEVWQHALCHDGESIIWSLFVWTVGAQPKTQAHHSIDSIIWSLLLPAHKSGHNSPEDDYRSTVLGGLASGCNVLQTGYQELQPLLQKLAGDILNDYYWAKDPNRRRPDYVHEILQRHILNFILDNNHEDFMDLEKKDI